MLSSMLPKENQLPTSRDMARHYVTSLGGLDYKCIDACINDSIVFHGSHIDAQEGPICGESRYRADLKTLDVPRKVL